MISQVAAHLALRNRALTLSVATTGSTTLSATASGYARTTGSFVTDGFHVGMEILTTGFPTNGYSVVSSVSALALGIAGGRTAAAAAAGRTITAGLPQGRAWEGVGFVPVSGRPFIEEDFVPATTDLWTFPASGGKVEETGLYFLKWYGLEGMGTNAIRASVDALKLLYAPGTAFLAGSDSIRIGSSMSTSTRGQVAGPQAGQIRPIDGGWLVLTLTIPWVASSTNLIAA